MDHQHTNQAGQQGKAQIGHRCRETVGQRLTAQPFAQQQQQLATIQCRKRQGVEHRQVDRDQRGEEQEAGATLLAEPGTHLHDAHRASHVLGRRLEMGRQVGIARNGLAGDLPEAAAAGHDPLRRPPCGSVAAHTGRLQRCPDAPHSAVKGGRHHHGALTIAALDQQRQRCGRMRLYGRHQALHSTVTSAQGPVAHPNHLLPRRQAGGRGRRTRCDRRDHNALIGADAVGNAVNGTLRQ